MKIINLIVSFKSKCSNLPINKFKRLSSLWGTYCFRFMSSCKVKNVQDCWPGSSYKYKRHDDTCGVTKTLNYYSLTSDTC